ncbi:prolyl oligopeptidase family serine peptidase [Shewanella sp. 1_MG-2023]|uniref:alpha/beta hydrolase family protein n=1 Tax=unclassified Shewanella TaxID=196818 RepID=UPI0026E12EE1|nr:MULTISPECIES: prolyl oligopeptidase family serine peptidase [unclassified Shewanella]MDO6612415.1 prolyl oligopeptidase family serine peptidase [Shewanella sp. 7_MG-2023]MDO6772544.1 prolyl oligopeptidase family serine peptidase [Shewanella sp. 2_MG-2023]MDO6794459.1 prolyl oligopeptidase family serine peptidase [Shewanella sp. 1_MG-2023]
MIKYFLLFTLLFSSFSTQAIHLINDDRISNQTDCFSSIFAEYDTWHKFMEEKYRNKIKIEQKFNKALSQFNATFSEDDFNHFKANLSCSTFSYSVNNTEVMGYVIKPRVSDTKLPVLVYNRGGNGNFGSVVFGAMMYGLFPIVEQGFVIIGSQYRGVHVKQPSAKDEFGGKDVNDVIALLDFIPNIEGADPQRIGMYGGSRGGMQTHLAMKQTNKIKAIATIAGVSDLQQGLIERPEMENVYKKRIPYYELKKDAELSKRSVINWASNLSPNVPILLIHGTEDKRVAANQSIVLADALTKYDIPHKLVLYPDNHYLRNSKEKVNLELVNWFQKYL